MAEPSGPPVRLRLSRQPGDRLWIASIAANGRQAVSVARPHLWGNPFQIGPGIDRAMVVLGHRRWLAGEPLPFLVPVRDLPGLAALRTEVLTRLPQLRGKNVGCWCHLDGPCHGDTLLELANA